MKVLDIHTHQCPSNDLGTAIFNYIDTTFSTNEIPFQKGGYYSVGLHPWYLSELEEEIACQFSWLNHCLESKQVIALGEAGLDKLAATPMDIQKAVFIKQIELSEQKRLPLIIHCVRALDELLQLKKKYHPVQPWIWHGFRGKKEQMNQLLQQGFYLSFGEFYQEEVIAATPDERLFLETDESKKKIEDLMVRAADIRSATVEQLRETIQTNVRNVFFTE